MKYVKAKPISYGSKRNRKNVRYIVIHNTGNKGDLAISNANYFAKANTRQAGAHIFIDQKGNIIKSIALNLIAWAVGGNQKSGRKGEAKYYGKCTNSNSVSIELCDIVNKYPSNDMIKSVKKAIKHIRKYCPNATRIIRHWDVNGKDCPHLMSGDENAKWEKFLRDIGEE